MTKKCILAVLAVFLFAQLASAVTPRQWEVRTKDEFLKGKLSGISISDEGFLSLSPKEEEIEAPSEEFYLSFILSPQGETFLGTGHGGKIYKISSSGKAELYFQVPEMDIYCLALDNQGALYAGTSPNGKVYKITAAGKGDVFFNPEEKYIWDLLFIKNGHLLAAVGESGGVYEINREGEGSLIFKAEQNHILCLKTTKEGDMLAGSGGKGLLYKFSPGNKASVLFESPFEEVKTIDIDGEGNIYVGAGGKVTKPQKLEIAPAQSQSETDIAITVTPFSGVKKTIAIGEEKHPSALYMVTSEGLAKKLWSSDEDLIYSLFWDSGEKKVIFGTGNKGRIFTLTKEGKLSLLLQKESEQIYGLIPFEKKIYVLSNNPSSLNVLYPEQSFDGQYLSQVLDTKTISTWGKIIWEAEIPPESSIQFQTRSGNSYEPGQAWSDWSPPYQKKEGEQILSPRGRYLQFKIIFKSQSGKISPLLSKVSLFYLQSNLAPVITKLELLPPHQVFLKPPQQEEVIWGIEEAKSASQSKNKTKSIVIAKKVKRKGFQTVIWDVVDDNGDELVFNIYLRREDEKKWQLIKTGSREKIHTFETLSFPDGLYFLKIEAVDSPSNPQGMELRAEKVSSPLVIDNSLPSVKNFQAVKNKGKLEVTFTAEDTTSFIKEVYYIVRPGNWKAVFPIDGICDSKQESFKLIINLSRDSDNLMTIKVVDSQDNIGVYRHTF